jgi:hypothetical protein
MAKKSKAGRPTVMTPAVVEKLELAFSKGLNDTEACLFAGIDRKTFYTFVEKNPEFLHKKDLLKSRVAMRSKLNIADSIDEGNVGDSWRYLEKTQGDEFADKLNLNATVKFV